ncbi:hypothetical protein [Herbiconiux daphne]|uniref:Lipoprotein n=1 Tax=Herbiconiux daphne TaxID=2970914 RepID=A0ABT2HA74_9MICO|nr:hypothetical protein [Herbiconiux daphne]MCS5736767.1 hypothetical protein [Herbiconiux daphne]
MKKIIALSIIIASLVGCARTQPNPNITTAHAGDDTASCLVLQSELTTAKNQLAEAQHDGNVQVGANIANTIIGVFDLVNLFFIDTGNGHSVDEQNAQARVQHIQVLLAEKNCR